MPLSGGEIQYEKEVEGTISISPYSSSNLASYGYKVHLHPLLKSFNICNLGCTSNCIYNTLNEVYVDNCKSGLMSYIDSKNNNPTIDINIPTSGYILEPGIFYIARLTESISSSKFDFYMENFITLSKLGGDATIGIDGKLDYGLRVTHPTKVYPNMEIGLVQFE